MSIGAGRGGDEKSGSARQTEGRAQKTRTHDEPRLEGGRPEKLVAPLLVSVCVGRLTLIVSSRRHRKNLSNFGRRVFKT